MTEQEHNPLKNKVLTAIKNGEVAMRPKWHFVLKAILGILGVVMVLMVLLYLSSFIMFELRETGILFIPVFGMHGISRFLISLPWVLISILIIFVIVLEMLVRHYSFAYRRPLLYSALGIVFIVVIGAIGLARTSLHGQIFNYTREHHLPLGEVYKELGRPKIQDIHRGVIMKLNPQGFIIKDRHAEMFIVVMTPHTRLPFGSDFDTDDIVVVFGPEQDHRIKAFGIREIKE